MYIKVPLVDHLRPLHKTSGSGIIAQLTFRNSTSESFAHGRYYTVSCIIRWIIVSAGIINSSITGVFEDPVRSDTPPYLIRNEVFWHTPCAETPNTEFLRFPCAETPVVEFLRFPCAAILHRTL